MAARELNRGVILYLAANLAVAGAILIHLFGGRPLALSTDLLALSVIGAIVAPHAVHLGMRVEMSISHPFILATMILLGERQALVVALVCIGSLCLFHRPRMPIYRAAFNMSSFVVTTWLTSETYLAFGGTPGVIDWGSSLTALMLATGVFYLANTYSVSGVVTLANGLNLFHVWQESFLWSAPSFLAGGSLALGMAYCLERFGIASFVLSLPFCVLIYSSYKLYLEKLEERRQHLKDIEQMNADLERKVRERTQELEVVNRKLQDSNQELARANSLKSEFLANMSHELRTPLNAIIGFSELLLDPSFARLGDEQRGCATDILSSGRHLLGLINDILDLSKIEAGKMVLQREVFEIGPVVEEAMALLRVEAQRKRLDLSARVENPAALLDADRSKIKQVLSNLLSNAVKFTPQEGRITLSVVAAGERMRLVVEDTGIGIAPEDQERIFQAFTQVDGSLARQYQGTGLGLTLVKRFVEMHGGSIALESRPGAGSRFVVEIPAACETARTSPEPGPDPRAAGAPGATPGAAGAAAREADLVFVIEDDPSHLRLVRDRLAPRGLRLAHSTSGEEALEALKFVRPDLILVDIQLPGMDGLQVTRLLRSRPGTRDVPILALTAYAMPGDEVRAKEAGCTAYMTKPIDAARFVAAVAQLLEGGRRPGGAAAGTAP